MSIIHHSTCPVCDSPKIDPLLTVKDHSVSGEAFVVWQCRNCALRFTQDAPSEDSIGRYYQSPEYISHSNTSKGMVNSLYQQVRKHTLGVKAKLVRGDQTSGHLLDVGAGVGAFVQTMKEEGWEVDGIEPDPGARQRAREDFQIELQETSALSGLPRLHYDAITLWHVLEHVHDLHRYMNQLRDLLKNEGRIFIAVPNYQSGDSRVYKLYWAAYDVPRHLYHFSPRSVEVLAGMHGLKLVAKKPMWFDSFYISLLSSKYKNGKTNWPGAVFNGIRSNLGAVFNRNHASSLIYILEKA